MYRAVLVGAIAALLLPSVAAANTLRLVAGEKREVSCPGGYAVHTLHPFTAGDRELRLARFSFAYVGTADGGFRINAVSRIYLRRRQWAAQLRIHRTDGRRVVHNLGDRVLSFHYRCLTASFTAGS